MSTSSARTRHLPTIDYPTTYHRSYHRPPIYRSFLAQSSTHHQSCLTIASSCLRAFLNTSSTKILQHRHPTYLTESSPSKMSTYADRLASFTTWPHTSPTPKQMARAGFIHMPTSEYPDRVICMTCEDNLYDWKPEDDPKLKLHIHHLRCSPLWLVLATTERKKPSISDIGFFNPSLAYDFPELCLFQNVKTFCDRIRRLRFFETDILDLLPSCLRGDALKWFK